MVYCMHVEYFLLGINGFVTLNAGELKLFRGNLSNAEK